MGKELIIEIAADTKRAVREIEKLKKEIKTFADSVENGNVKLKNQEKALFSLANQIKSVAAAYMGFQGIKGAIDIIGNFEEQIAKLGAISGASGGELDKLKAKAQELGKSTMFSASEVAEGMNYLAMAGYKTEDIMASIGDVLKLAQVGMVDLATASDIASNILSGFGLSADETRRVVDVMAATITNANTNIPELGEAMKYVAPQARSLGVSLEETAAAIGVLSNAGIKASMAGTGLATMLTRLSAPTGAAADALDELGIKVYDANGKFVGLQNVLMQFKDKLKGLSQEAKAKYIRDIFGIETMKTALTLIDSVGGEFDELYKKLAKSMGVSEEMAKKMSNTFKGHVKELSSAIEGLVITIGNELLPALTEFVKGVTESVRNVEEFYKKNKELINTIADIAFEIGKLIAVFYSLKKITAFATLAKDSANFLKGIIELRREVGLLKTALNLLGRANVVILGLTLAFEALSAAVDVYREIERLNNSIKNLNNSTKLLNDSNAEFSKLLDEVKSKMDFSDGKREIRASAEELERLKQKTKDLIDINNKRIEQLKKLYEEDKSPEIKEQIDQLIDRNRVLEKLYTKLQNTRPYDATKTSAEEATQAVERLSQREIETLTKNYQKRITEHSQMITKLEAKEQELVNKIAKLQEELNQKLRDLENQRLLAIQDIEDKIHNLQMQGASDYEKFVDTKKRAEEAFAKAKKALEEGNFSLAKSYMSRYESLITSLTNKEIEENGRVLVSKEEANQIVIDGLKRLEGLTNEYYSKEKQLAQESYTQKLTLLKAELTALKTQLELQKQRLELEKQLVEMLTGKKVEIDTSEATKAIQDIEKRLKTLDESLENKKADIKVEADTKDAEEKIDKIDEWFKQDKKVSIDLDEAKERFEEFKKKYNIVDVEINGDNKKAIDKVNEVENEANSLKPVVEVNSDVSEALNKLSQIPREIVTIHRIKVVEERSSGGIVGKYATGGRVEFKRINGKIPGYDPQDKDDVPALLTRGEFVVKRDAVRYYGDEFLYKLNNKLLPKFASGGLVTIGNVSTSPVTAINTTTKTTLEELEKIEVDFNVDLSVVDELKEAIKDLGEFLKETFVNKGVSLNGESIGGVFAKDYRNLEIEVNKAVRDFESKVNSDKEEVQRNEDIINTKIERANELANRANELQSSLQGSILDVSAFNSLSSNISSLQEEYESLVDDIEKRKEYLDEFLETAYEKIDKEEQNLMSYEDKIYSFKEMVDEYLSEVEDEKAKIRDKLTELGIEDILSDNFETTMDLDKLKSYSNLLENLSLEKIKEEIKKELQSQLDLLKPQLDWAAERYYTHPLLAPNYFNLKAEYDEIYNTLNNNSKLEALAKEELIKRLPKFQTGGLIALQNGGKLSGYGGGDRNLALLEDGEFVIRKEAVRYFGSDLFERLNSLKLPKFQVGGLVGNFKTSSPADMVNVNFRFPDGKSFKLQGPEDVAKSLSQYLKRII